MSLLGLGQDYDDDVDYSPNSLNSLDNGLRELENELAIIESEILTMESLNSGENSVGSSQDNTGENSGGSGQENSGSPNVIDNIGKIDYSHVFNQVKAHYKRNKFIMWIILGVAIFLALIACPSWVACCIGVFLYKKHQRAKQHEKFNYDATSDSDEEKDSSSGIGDSLVKRITTVSQKRRTQRKDTYEPLKSED